MAPADGARGDPHWETRCWDSGAQGSRGARGRQTPQQSHTPERKQRGICPERAQAPRVTGTRGLRSAEVAEDRLSGALTRSGL